MDIVTTRLGRYLKAVSSTVLGRIPAGRDLTVLPDDVFLVSYRRSGSTWFRFLVGNLIQENEPVTFANVERLVPYINAFPDRVLRRSPRVLKSHECFDPRYPRVVYLIRDPRDVAVSFYFYHLKVRRLTDGYPLDQFVERFMVPKVADYSDRVGNWEEHVLSWVRLRQGKPNFKLLRYEDLLSDPAAELTKLVPFLGIDPNPKRIDRAVRLSSASHMRALEKQQWRIWVTTRRTRGEIPFVREATSGGWRSKLSSASVRAIEEAWGNTMKEFGYELSWYV